MPEEPVLELAPLSDFLQKIGQGIVLVHPTTDDILHTGGAAMGDDVVYRPANTLQRFPGDGVFRLAGQLLLVPRGGVVAVLGAVFQPGD